MFRLILFGIGALIIALATIICYPLYRIIRKINRKKGDWFALHFVQTGFALFIFMCGVKVTYKGLENLPKDGEAVLFELPRLVEVVDKVLDIAIDFCTNSHALPLLFPLD